ncbi:hypothetical protein Taro_044506 [Colocasia esculenta]|uniref:Tryptophan synthase beta chain-like PALP domain-containing protein n=1 Tax=Colocasia esculenta TaxID=4460 RepID=A0A843WM49_COLES|nr:hypothetical protein [Colocasia esculenta]
MERALFSPAPCGTDLRLLPRSAAAAAAPPPAASSNLSFGVSTHRRRCLQSVGDGDCVRGTSHLPAITLASTAAASSRSPAPIADAREESSPSTLSSPSAASDAASVLPDVKLKRVTVDSLQYESGYLGGITGKTRPPWGASWTSAPPTVGRPGAMDYLANTLTSRVYDVAIESPLQLAPKLSERLGVQFWLKREDLQPVFSFKLRGAYNMMANLPREKLEKGVICSSAGNHAQGVALSAQKLGCNAVIAMPVTTPEIKWKSVERLGATVVLVGDSYDEAQAYAKQRAEQEGRTFIPPFDNPQVITGQGTVGMEIVRQLQGPLHAIFVPVGGGGLIAGIAAYVKQVRPEVCVFELVVFFIMISLLPYIDAL